MAREISQTVDVTVVISTYNRANYIGYAIESILKQTCQAARIIVVDDGSTDKTQEVLSKFLPHIDVVTQENAGKAAALNAVIPLVETEFVWFFDDDDVALQDALERLVSAHQHNTELAFTFGDLYRSTGDANLTPEGLDYTPYAFAKLSPDEQRLQLFHSSTVMMTSALIRTSAVRHIGGFNKRLSRAQDYDLLVRLASEFEFRYCEAPVYILRIHDGERGGAGGSHGHEDRAKVWAHYRQFIGYHLRYDLPLMAMLPGQADAAAESEVFLLRQALITRAWTLVNKLPIEIAFADLFEACHWDPRTPVTAEERKRITSTFGQSFKSNLGDVTWSRTVRLCGSIAGSEVAQLIAKARYWALRAQPNGFFKFRSYLKIGCIYSTAKACEFSHWVIQRLPYKPR